MRATLKTKLCMPGLLNIAFIAILSTTPAAHAELSASADRSAAAALTDQSAAVSPIATQTSSLLSYDLESKTPEYVILQPIDEATFSSETTASVDRLFVKEGSYFRSGDILLELDCRVQKAELQRAVAQSREAEMALKSALKLKSYGSISEYELVKAKAEREMVSADVSKLSAIVDKCVIKAPFNGAVAELKVHAHETVKPGDPLIKIVNTDRIIIEMEVPSEWLQWLHINTGFNVHVNEINKTIAARIIRINPKIEPVSQTVKIVGEISDLSDKLLPGMSGQASFPDKPDHSTKSSTR
jgi:membrane fusion protein, multidrug efflux system